MDLEKELTCSICTEVLYQPLTLLDCLHSFCGSCLKEWFKWQATTSKQSASHLEAGNSLYTCPSCRANVRETKHNATVTTLIEMLLAANPEKAKSEEEREEMRKKYTPGEDVMPQMVTTEKSSDERRRDEEDLRLMDEVRNLSLREVGVGQSTTQGQSQRISYRRREEVRSPGWGIIGGRDNSEEGRSSESREHRRRDETMERRRRRTENDGSRSARVSTERARRAPSHDRTRNRSEEVDRSAARQIEHQSSLRSLLSTSDVDSHEMEEEILRQIHEEGLLDGIDLENIDVNQEDHISERIAEAFKRRQNERTRADDSRANNSSTSRPRVPELNPFSPRDTTASEGERSRSARRQAHSRATRSISQSNEASRSTSALPVASHLEVNPGTTNRRRRRTNSTERSSTILASTGSTVGTSSRPAARSQTDISDRPSSSSHAHSSRSPIASPPRSITDPSTRTAGSVASTGRSSLDNQVVDSTTSENASTTPRSSNSTKFLSSGMSTNRSDRPPNISMPDANSNPINSAMKDQNNMTTPRSAGRSAHYDLSERAAAIQSGLSPTISSSDNIRARSLLYQEPSITCSRCSKAHIEYELHYNCDRCHDGGWNVCLQCYRSARGCLFWFGFGYGAWTKWERLKSSGELSVDAEQPHMLTANRYIPPKTQAGGADGRRTLTTSNPSKRLQSGTFCAICLGWTNECYWRCDKCNEGDWGFCSLCIDQGKCCTHPLLPLLYRPTDYVSESSTTTMTTPPLSPSKPYQTPSSATLLTGPGVIEFGAFKPLTFSTRCDICHYPIQPSSTRYHCYSCVSTVPETLPGDYDVCSGCYLNLETKKRISLENGHKGWRRCLRGHRMAIVGFQDILGGQRRVIVSDIIGGLSLLQEAYPPTESSFSAGTAMSGNQSQTFQKWSWADGARLVTINVADTAPLLPLSDSKIHTGQSDRKSPPPLPPRSLGSNEGKFPPSDGLGLRALAMWSWYPKEGMAGENELMFPKGAELRECKDINGDWYIGAYAGERGLFPAPFVQLL